MSAPSNASPVPTTQYPTLASRILAGARQIQDETSVFCPPVAAIEATNSHSGETSSTSPPIALGDETVDDPALHAPISASPISHQQDVSSTDAESTSEPIQTHQRRREDPSASPVEIRAPDGLSTSTPPTETSTTITTMIPDTPTIASTPSNAPHSQGPNTLALDSTSTNTRPAPTASTTPAATQRRRMRTQAEAVAEWFGPQEQTPMVESGGVRLSNVNATIPSVTFIDSTPDFIPYFVFSANGEDPVQSFYTPPNLSNATFAPPMVDDEDEDDVPYFTFDSTMDLDDLDYPDGFDGFAGVQELGDEWLDFADAAQIIIGELPSVDDEPAFLGGGVFSQIWIRRRSRPTRNPFSCGTIASLPGSPNRWNPHDGRDEGRGGCGIAVSPPHSSGPDRKHHDGEIRRSKRCTPGYKRETSHRASKNQHAFKATPVADLATSGAPKTTASHNQDEIPQRDVIFDRPHPTPHLSSTPTTVSNPLRRSRPSRASSRPMPYSRPSLRFQSDPSFSPTLLTSPISLGTTPSSVPPKHRARAMRLCRDEAGTWRRAGGVVGCV